MEVEESRNRKSPSQPRAVTPNKPQNTVKQRFRRKYVLLLHYTLRLSIDSSWQVVAGCYINVFTSSILKMYCVDIY